jgi:hypothetical protein
MHPEIARALAAQHRDELMRDAGTGRRAVRRTFPRWHVSWTRTVLAPAMAPGSAGANRAGRAGRRGSSLVIIITAHRSA